MNYENKKYTAVLIGVSIIIILWTAHLVSFFSISNGYSYDVLTRSYSPSQASEHIIVIELDSSYALKGDEVWVTMLEQILLFDVKQIAFTFLPEKVSDKFYQLAIDSGKTVFAAQVVKNSEKLTHIVQAFPKAVEDKKIVYGLVSTVPHQHGVVRAQHAVIKANGLSFPSFEKRVAEQVISEAVQLPETDFRVNFIGNKNRIPRIRIQRILEKGLVNELLSDRTVLIGVNEHEFLSQHYTPISTDQQLTSSVMFHAFALDTLLSDRQIIEFPSWVFLLLILLITGASLFLCQWLTFQMSLIVSMVATIVYVMASWFTLHFLYLWMPITELLLAQWLSFALVWRNRVNQENKSLDQMLLGLSLKLREKVHHVGFYNSKDPWEQLIVMINQLLHLNRFIFLERVEGDHRLKEIKAFNCSIDDIKEMRRDYERQPYSTAISENRPILLDRIYLKKVETNERQYLAPLIFAGEILGFWAFTVDPKWVVSEAKFNKVTHDFMRRISEILHYRQEWQKHLHTEKNKLWSYLRVEGGSEHLQQLNQSVNLMDKRISELQEVFNSINTSCVLYDIFGRVMLVNKDMNTLTKEADIRLFNITLLEFIVEISAYDGSDARNLLQQIIIDREAVSIPVVHNTLNRSFMLHMKPLNYQSEKNGGTLIPDENQVFKIDGVLCELIDTTELSNLYQLKEKMFERFNYQIRNDLSSILFALPMLEDQQLDKKEKQFVLENVEGKIDETLNTLALVKEQMDVEIENMLTSTLLCYPVDGRIPMLKMVSELQGVLDSNGIKLHLKLPELIGLVFASQRELEIVLHAVLLALIEDTYAAGEIWIVVVEEKHNIKYQIHNNGIGISNNSLHKFENNELSQESDILKFHYAIRCVNRWGGSLNITSQMGEGSRAELLLRRFM